MSAAKSIVEDYLRKLQGFYTADKPFYQQRRYLIQAITYPARWVDKRGVFLPEAAHRAILDEIISGIRKHANLATVRNFGVYFLDCVQRHFAVPSKAERYYDYAKGLRAQQDAAAQDLVNRVQIQDSPAAITDELAELDRLVRSPGRRRKKSGSTQIQLFR